MVFQYVYERWERLVNFYGTTVTTRILLYRLCSDDFSSETSDILSLRVKVFYASQLAWRIRAFQHQ